MARLQRDQRRAAEDRLLGLVGRTARRRHATLYYPAAGTDLEAFLRTRARRAVFLDPAYLRRSAINQRVLTRIVRAVDAQAKFTRHGRRVLIAEFAHRGESRTVTFIRGAAGKDERLARRYAAGGVVVLVKGSLSPNVLCPSATIQELHPTAYALILLDVPAFAATIQRGYREPLFRAEAGPLHLRMYRQHRHTDASRRRAQRELGTWLATSRSGGRP